MYYTPVDWLMIISHETKYHIEPRSLTKLYPKLKMDEVGTNDVLG
jgi:hypothetical protein